MKPIRILTAVGPYDGHDVSIHALNRSLLDMDIPVEVIYQGYQMSASKLTIAAGQEDVDAIAVSSYNGGHLQFFPFLAGLLQKAGLDHVLIFGGGGATISPEDEEIIENQGTEKIYGTQYSLADIVKDMVKRIIKKRNNIYSDTFIKTCFYKSRNKDYVSIGNILSLSENINNNVISDHTIKNIYYELLKNKNIADPKKKKNGKVVFFTGAGGAGKSTIIDEIVKLFIKDFPHKYVAVISNDPTIIKGEIPKAFLGDRVRMNSLYHPHVFMRSVTSRKAYELLSSSLNEMIEIIKHSRFDLIIIETPGTGQTGIDLSFYNPDVVVYVKTKEYGTGLQLQKEQSMLDSDFVVLNKIDLPGSRSAYDELKQFLMQNGRAETLYASLSKTYQDPGVISFYTSLMKKLHWKSSIKYQEMDPFSYTEKVAFVPHSRRGYLAEIIQSVRDYDKWVDIQLSILRESPGCINKLDDHCKSLLNNWQEEWEKLVTQAAQKLNVHTCSHSVNGFILPKVLLPDPDNKLETLRFLLQEGLPGLFPFVTGIYPLRLEKGGKTTRQFAGLKGPGETNKRLKMLAKGVKKPRLSIAFDGITLYGDDSDEDPSSIGKIGEGGVSVDTYEDFKLILSGFNIKDISTSMTINGPAPILLAMYFNACIDLEIERVEKEKGKKLTGKELVRIKKETYKSLRGTIQSDILKEIQAQNECIFTPDFAIKLMGDIQKFFIKYHVDHFYPVSISGYHIGEAGATVVQELAFTLANGFTYVENFLSRGMAIDEFASKLTFFFRVSHEVEWFVYGAVCRKIWAIAMRDIYKASENSQKLKYHTQTSGRALQAEEWDTVNPIRQTYHALLALLSNTNSLHVDSADEPMTTPGSKYVLQAAMIPNYLIEEAETFLIQNLLSGSYAFRYLFKEVQKAVLKEMEKIDQLGGVGPATEMGYHRRSIAKSSLTYEMERRRGAPGVTNGIKRKIIGYNVYELPYGHPDKYPPVPALVRPSEKDRQKQIKRVKKFRNDNKNEVELYLQRLRKTAKEGSNVFEELMETVRHASLGQITKVLYEIGGQYRKMV